MAASKKGTTEPTKEKQTRRVLGKKGHLAAKVAKVCELYSQGKIKIDDEGKLTPHRISTLVQMTTGDEEAPSVGACSAVLARWKEQGFVLLNAKPVSFKDFTAKGKKLGFEGFYGEIEAKKQAERDKVLNAKAAEKAAEKAKRDAEREAVRAEKKAAADLVKAAEKAKRDAERAEKRATREAEKAAEKAKRDAEREAQKAAKAEAAVKAAETKKAAAAKKAAAKPAKGAAKKS